jgi:hypothetical protein
MAMRAALWDQILQSTWTGTRHRRGGPVFDDNFVTDAATSSFPSTLVIAT